MLVKRGIAALIAGFMLWTGVMAQAEALSAGDRGEEVEALQQRLIELNYLASGQADGIYGRRPRRRWKIFSRPMGLQLPARPTMSPWRCWTAIRPRRR